MLANKIANQLITKLPAGYVRCYGTGKARPKFITNKVASFTRVNYDDYKSVPKPKG